MPNISQNFNSSLYQYPQNVGYNMPSKGIEDLKKQDSLVGDASNAYDIPSDPVGFFKRLGLGILMSMGFVHMANWSMTTPKITDTMSQIDAYQASRLYKAGAKLDSFGPLQWIVKQGGKLKAQIAKIPVPNFLREAGSKMKTGTVSAWDSTGMYSIGKAAEAMKESLEFFSQVDETAIRGLTKNTNVQQELIALMQKFRAGKINHVKAFNELDNLLKQGGVTAKALDAISKQRGNLSKVLGTTQNLNVSLSKARFFLGRNANGPVSKALNKAYSLWTEASGGGVLGGGMCLFMNAIGLITAFHAADHAEKGDKLKAFMEDYWGFTIGGYVGGMFVGKLFHKFLGLGENGMRLNSAECKEAAQRLGLEGIERVQDAVLAYNKEFKGAAKLQKYLNKLNKGKVVESGGIPILSWLKRKLLGQMTVAEAQKTLSNLGIVSADAKVSASEIAAKAREFVTGHSDGYFKPIREKLISAMKMPDVKFSQIWKGGGAFTEKATLKRLGEWIMKKPVATFAKLLGTGKYTLLKNGNFFGNFFRGLKRNGGGIGRMILVGFILVEPIRKFAMKASHKVFGKPKKSQLDEENRAKEQKAQQKQQEILNNQLRQAQMNNKMPQRPSQKLVDMYTQNTPKNIPEPAPKNQIPKLKEDSATYVPDQVLGQESYIDPGITQELLQRRDIALMQADAAERNARDVLSRF